MSFLAAWQLAINFQVAGAMLGLAIGHAILLVLLCASIYKEIGNHDKVQGLCSAWIMLSAGRILEFLGLGAVQTGVFQVSVLATFLLLIFMSLLMILHYLDKRRDAMWCTIVFTVVNASVTAWTIVAGERWYGFGFMVASGVGVMIAATWVNKHIRDLEFFTFTSQPLYG